MKHTYFLEHKMQVNTYFFLELLFIQLVTSFPILSQVQNELYGNVVWTPAPSDLLTPASRRVRQTKRGEARGKGRTLNLK